MVYLALPPPGRLAPCKQRGIVTLAKNKPFYLDDPFDGLKRPSGWARQAICF